MKKESSYQKLKAKNRELLSDIATLINYSESIAARKVKAKYNILYKIEYAELPPIRYGQTSKPRMMNLIKPPHEGMTGVVVFPKK